MSTNTKELLADSLSGLLCRKTLANISIKDITDGCGLNRQTFYYHFQDVYDLLRWIFEQKTAIFVAEGRRFASWEEGLLAAFALARANKSFIVNAYRSIARELLEKYLSEQIHDIVMTGLREVGSGLDIDEGDLDFIARFYTYAFLGYAMAWVGDDMREEPVLIVGRLSKLTEGNLRRGLERFSK